MFCATHAHRMLVSCPFSSPYWRDRSLLPATARRNDRRRLSSMSNSSSAARRAFSIRSCVSSSSIAYG
uniref:Uncharacterized protein n=1 Tax=uncultured marine virus TaxID=186617 RepID=A0A0F7L279_9VIRU|nr:hypothetical protein [uncultured marine virus]